MFSNTNYFKKIVLILGSIFFAPHLTRQHTFYAPIFFRIAEILQGRALFMSHCMHCVFLQLYCMQSSIGLALDILCLALNLWQNSQYL